MAGLISSWCDKLAAVPAVGFKLDNHFAPGATILEALCSVLDPLMDNEEQKFTMDQNDAFAISFTTEDGFKYGVNNNRVSVQFQHRMKAKPVSGGPPIMEMLSRPAPYTEVLPIVAKKAIDAVLHIPSPKWRMVQRIGIVTAAAVDENDLPPGIALFLKYMGRPWKGLYDGFLIQITSRLGEESGVSDRCVHTLTKSENPEELINVQFDWQRTFTGGRQIDPTVLKDIFESAENAALKYFEELAEGNRFDEDILRDTS